MSFESRIPTSKQNIKMTLTLSPLTHFSLCLVVFLPITSLSHSSVGNGVDPILPKLYSDSLQSLHPKKQKIFEFWGDNGKLKSLNLQVGDEVIFTTKGNSIFLDSLHRSKSGAFGNFSESYVTSIFPSDSLFSHICREKEVLGGWAAKVNKVFHSQGR